jgi:hypothetical protein
MSDETKDIKIDSNDRSFGMQTLTEGELHKSLSMNSSGISPEVALDIMGGNPFSLIPSAEPAVSSPTPASTDAGANNTSSTDSD